MSVDNIGALLTEKKEWLASQSAAFFLYDIGNVESNVAEIKNSWATINKINFDVFYSVKCNPNPHLISSVGQYVSGFDVSSPAELEMLIRIGIDPKRITVSGPAKTMKFLGRAASVGVRSIHIDSNDELEFFKNNYRGHRPGLTLRLALEGGSIRKLGLTEAEIEKILSSSEFGQFDGFHIYLGRESFDPNQAKKILDQFESLFASHHDSFGNIPAVYFGAGIPDLDKMDLQSEMAKIFQNKKYNFPVHLECGRALTSSAGYYGAQVLSVKKNDNGRRAVIVDGGIQHISGGIVSPKFGTKGTSILVMTKDGVNKSNTSKAVIFGSLCLGNDIVHPGAELPHNLLVGDWILFSSCGAYGVTASPNQFISTSQPSEWLLIDKKNENKIEILNISPDRMAE